MIGLLFVLLGIVAAALGAVAFCVWRLRTMSSDEQRVFITQSLRRLFYWLEARRLVPRSKGIVHDYHRLYPELRILEDNHKIIRDECLGLLERKDELVDLAALGGSYTDGGVHAVGWKTYTLKLGELVPENCERCPRTAALLERIPYAYTAFFSILDAKQYISPHWGYYRGFHRYHLGVLVPHDNADRSCWLRVHDDLHDNTVEDRSSIAKGEKYYWRNGRGIVFDDTYLHDAENGSDETRIVLFVDLRKKLPFLFDRLNALLLYFARRDASLRRMRENAVVAG